MQDLQERAQNWNGVAVEDERLVDLSRLLWPFLAFKQSDDQREVFAPCAGTPAVPTWIQLRTLRCHER